MAFLDKKYGICALSMVEFPSDFQNAWKKAVEGADTSIRHEPKVLVKAAMVDCEKNGSYFPVYDMAAYFKDKSHAQEALDQLKEIVPEGAILGGPTSTLDKF